jgi:serine/threonine protein kinase
MATKIATMRTLSSHPNMLKLHGVFEDEEGFHVVLEYCKGAALLEQIHNRVSGGGGGLGGWGGMAGGGGRGAGPLSGMPQPQKANMCPGHALVTLPLQALLHHQSLGLCCRVQQG